jgi:Protein of unknown function, DUF488
VSIQVRRNSLATPPKRERKKTTKAAPLSQKPAADKPAALSKAKLADEVDLELSSSSPAADDGHVPALQSSASTQLTIFTIGHSTHPIEEFIALLKNYGIEQLVDVRTVPKSRHVPQFNSDALASALGDHGVAYVHLKALGGLRHAKKDSINTAWRNSSFRGYADYMATEEFAKGIDRLIELAKVKRTVIMCAEAVPWRCHRSLVGDALLVRGIAAEDIMGATSVRPHKLTEFAKVDGQQITYPPDKNLELFSSSSDQESAG